MPRIGGSLGKASVTVTDATTVYTVPADHETTCNVNVCNIGTENAVVRLAISPSAAPAAADWIEYGISIPPGTPLERTGVIMKAGERIVVQRVGGGNIAVDVRGIQGMV